MKHSTDTQPLVLTYGRYRTGVVNCKDIQPQRYTFDVEEAGQPGTKGAEHFACQEAGCHGRADWVLTFGASDQLILTQHLVCSDCMPTVAARKLRTVKRKSCACD